ncbi:MAG: TetR/AcrR family transcriptional regulator [Peptococcaceae bacterium]|nr:TetR/AcrR family transcriptional regulator [Peptococcaceae bacterium]
MSPKIFSITEREELRVKMLDAGFELIKQYGMTHASVEKITQAAGLGKSTFYNFFSSKEAFVMDIMEYQRDQVKQHFENLLNGREKMTAAEGKDYLRLIVFSQNSIYQYLTAEDMEKLQKACDPEWSTPDNASYEKMEEATMHGLFDHMEGVRPDMDYHVVANLIKIMALAKVNREVLHTDALDRTLDHIYELLYGLIFVEGA